MARINRSIARTVLPREVIDAAQVHYGPELDAAAVKDTTPMTEEEAKGWGALGCAAEFGARNQKADVLTIAAQLDESDAN